MSFLEKNLEAIKNHRNYLYKCLEEIEFGTKDHYLDEIRNVETKDNVPAVELTIQSRKYRLNSLYHPISEAEKWTEQFNMKNIAIVTVMFGLGNGVFVKELLKKINEDSILVIYEPSPEIFFFILNNYDITDILSSDCLSLTIEGINDNEIRNILSNYVSWVNLKSQIVCFHPQYDLIFKERKEIFNKIILDNNNRAIVNKNTDIAISKAMVSNLISNLKHIKRCNLVTDLIGKFDTDLPAIIVAAGPSLDKNIDELKLAKNKAIIFSVDTAVKYLLAKDIEPDFIVTLDPVKSNYHMADERWNNIPILCRVESRQMYINNNKNIIYFNLEGYAERLFGKINKNSGILNSGGSVATGAFSVCETLGFKRIILVGQDLAYSGNSTHAGGKNVDASGSGNYIELVDDIYGNKIKTRYDWYIYIKWFEDAIALFHGDEVIDATEGGAKIKGTTILNLKDTIDKYCVKNVDCNKIISELQPSLNEAEIAFVTDCMKADIEDLSDLKEKSHKAKDICDKLIRKYEKSVNETNSSMIKNKELSQLNADMESKAVYQLVDWYISSVTINHLKDLYLYTDDEQQNKLVTYNKANIIYTAILESIDEIKPLLENTLQSLIQENINN